MFTLEQLQDEGLDIPDGAYTIESGQTLIVWYDTNGKRHVNGMGAIPNER